MLAHSLADLTYQGSAAARASHVSRSILQHHGHIRWVAVQILCRESNKKASIHSFVVHLFVCCFVCCVLFVVVVCLPP